MRRFIKTIIIKKVTIIDCFVHRFDDERLPTFWARHRSTNGICVFHGKRGLTVWALNLYWRYHPGLS
jgi:hypothetical protein